MLACCDEKGRTVMPEAHKTRIEALRELASNAYRDRDFRKGRKPGICWVHGGWYYFMDRELLGGLVHGVDRVSTFGNPSNIQAAILAEMVKHRGNQ